MYVCMLVCMYVSMYVMYVCMYVLCYVCMYVCFMLCMYVVCMHACMGGVSHSLGVAVDFYFLFLCVFSCLLCPRSRRVWLSNQIGLSTDECWMALFYSSRLMALFFPPIQIGGRAKATYSGIPARVALLKTKPEFWNIF